MNNQVMVPLRFVSEALGALVNYDSASKTISIKSNDDQVAATNVEAANSESNNSESNNSESNNSEAANTDVTNAPVEEVESTIDFAASKETVKLLISELYKKDPALITTQQQEKLDNVLFNRPLLIASLFDLYNENDPTWTTNFVEYSLLIISAIVSSNW